MTAVADGQVRVVTQGTLGRITLTRPRALNALTHSMILAIDDALVRFAADDAVAGVLLDAEGERGFCAGGDVKAVAQSAAGDGSAARALWRDEYRMNARIARYPKPVVALLPGVVFGGGVGLGCHARTRVVTADTRMGMPEVTLGLVPDVGGPWLLARAPGELGTHLALTADSAGPADAIACGLADVHLPPAAFAALVTATSPDELSAMIATDATSPDAGELLDAQEWIDACYAVDDVRDVLARLDARPERGAREAAATIRTKSPTALQVTLQALRHAHAQPTLEAALAQDYRVMSMSLTRADVREGVRAQLIDRDRSPRWNPATLDEVSPELVASHFTPRPGDELELS